MTPEAEAEFRDVLRTLTGAEIYFLIQSNRRAVARADTADARHDPDEAHGLMIAEWRRRQTHAR